MKTHTYLRPVHITAMICIVHCIITSLLLVVAPVIAGYFENLWLELCLLCISICCGIFIIYTGYCRHKKRHAMVVFCTGIALWAIHALSEDFGCCGKFNYLVLGTLFVLGSYYMNHRYLKCCPSAYSSKK